MRPINPINPSLTRLAVGFNTSGVELLQSQARKAKFFKALNGVSVMARPQFPEGAAVMLSQVLPGRIRRPCCALSQMSASTPSMRAS